MSFNIKVFLLCPVPEDQKPINEYITIKKNSFLNWTTCSLKNYLVKIISGYLFAFPVFLICFLTLTPFSFFEIVKIFLLSANFFFISILIRWSTINKRLVESRVFYEEASWFDGQIWEKPFFLIKNDKLLSSQKIEPVLKRIWGTIFVHVSLCLVILNL
tara:strand:+ start:6305 stop:6781 length:477 start_codon:yes stop_codon:yes gene_type:complete